MLRRPHYIVLVLVVVLILVILNLPGHTTARLKLAIGSLFLPLFGLASSSQELADKTANSLASRPDLLRQNEALRRENQELRLQSWQAQETARENTRLRQIHAWPEKTRWKHRLANVVLHDPANWWRTIQIDLGSRDGMRENLPVLTTDGLVGRIKAVSLTRSQVVLVGDPDCKVSALVQNAAGDMGVIGKGGPFDGSLVDMSYLSGNANLVPGQTVITSGKGGIFPQGIPIGTIVDSRQVDYGVYLEARVRLFANPGALNEVLVLIP